MRRFALLSIASVASAIVCLQNLPSVTGFTWALIHGAGLSSVLAFLPAAIAFAVVWAGHYGFKKKVRSHAALAFAAFAIGVVALNEWLLPATPLKEWRDHRAMEEVRVLAMRDEPLLTAHGNPIGVRVSFDAVVARTAAYTISPSTLMSALGETIWPLHFGHGMDDHIQPTPTPQRDTPYGVFQKDVVYTFTQNMMPNFVQYDEKTKTPCLVEVRTKYITEADFLSALAANRDVTLRMEIQVSGEYSAVSRVAAEGVTAGHYDMQAIYETIAKEGGGRCQ